MSMSKKLDDQSITKLCCVIGELTYAKVQNNLMPLKIGMQLKTTKLLILRKFSKFWKEETIILLLIELLSNFLLS